MLPLPLSCTGASICRHQAEVEGGQPAEKPLSFFFFFFSGLFLYWFRSLNSLTLRSKKQSIDIFSWNISCVLTESMVNKEHHSKMLTHTERFSRIAQHHYKTANMDFTQPVNTKQEQRATMLGSPAACYWFYTTKIQWESLCERLRQPSETLFHTKVLWQAQDLGLTQGFLPAGCPWELPRTCQAGCKKSSGCPGGPHSQFSCALSRKVLIVQELGGTGGQWMVLFSSYRTRGYTCLAHKLTRSVQCAHQAAPASHSSVHMWQHFTSGNYTRSSSSPVLHRGWSSL